jgi:tRNA threonylcarbamoyladenosine biosynthesis protein TsaB
VIVLSAETSTSTGSVALLEDGVLIGELVLLNRKHHSQRILGMIAHLLKECGLDLKEIDLFSVAVGPGSFTGLRVGVATMKGLATGLSKPLKGVSTLEAFAGQMGYTPYPICPLIPARKNEVYTALFQYESRSRLTSLRPVKIVSLDQFWSETKGPLHLLGEIPEKWLEMQEEKEFYYSPHFRHPKAVSIAQTAYRQFIEKKEISDKDLELVMPEFPMGKSRQDGMHF